MTTLHKFKLLASQCSVSGSSTRSPTASPVIHLRRRRRKTLRMLLNRTDRRRFPYQDDSMDLQDVGDEDEHDERIFPQKNDNREIRARRKLKDLFVSSPPPPALEDKVCLEKRSEEGEGLLRVSGGGNSAASSIRRSLRPISATFRYRFLRRAWRPVLVAIPE